MNNKKHGNWLNLKIGDRIKIGKKSSENCNLPAGKIITLIEGSFDHENGLYTEIQTAPSIWDEKTKDFDSIYHIFGNDLEDFLDSEVFDASKSSKN